MIQSECTFEKIKVFYDQLFAPQATALHKGKTWTERRESFKNEGQQDQRNFISVRVFSKKFKNDITNPSLQ